MKFTQPGGVGDGAENSALLGAWLGVDVLVEEGGTLSVLDTTDGLTVTVAEDGATLESTGTSGAARILSLVGGVETIRVIEYTRDDAGDTLRHGIAPPLDGERRGERGLRGYASAWERDFFTLEDLTGDAISAGATAVSAAATATTAANAATGAAQDATDAVVDLTEQVEGLDARVAVFEPLDLPTVIMFNGQSNMANGAHPTAGFSELTPLLGPDILGFNQITQTMTQVVDGGACSRANFGGYGTGPGPGLGQIGTRLARMIADTTGGTVRTYALARAGKSITHFLPASGDLAEFEDGSQHPTLNNFNLMLSYVTATGIIPQWEIWCQGEADAAMLKTTYRAHLETRRTALKAAYGAGFKQMIIGTIGNRDDRAAVGEAAVTGVRKAQREFCEAHPDDTLFLDNTDMRGLTSWFSGLHYYYSNIASSAGYEEVALRCFAALRGLPDRPAVPETQHPVAVWPTFDHWWGYRHSIAGTVPPHTLASWQDDIGTDSLGVENGSPEHIASDTGFGGRAVIQFDRASSDRFTVASIAGGNKWFFFWSMRVSRIDVHQCVWQLEEASVIFGYRLGFDILNGGAPAICINGGDITFTGAYTLDVGVEHTYGVMYDGTAGTAQLWIDGVLQSTRTGLADCVCGPNARIRVGSFSGASHFTGEIAFIACEAAPAAFPTAAEMAEMHAGARSELKLET